MQQQIYIDILMTYSEKMKPAVSYIQKHFPS